MNSAVYQLRRVFCVIARYETLSGTSDGYQMAFPDAGFQWLRDRMGVTMECFASPLNCWNQRFCSVARDTDRFFGSQGNFFKFEGTLYSGCI
jgi:phosphorylated CTD-interacting factor 1